tara:strand:+ start:1233 stop:2177 length:945 start_codon:yes stop_codon:yes gene_type:complete
MNLAKDIIKGNRTALGQGITLIESTLPKHKKQAQELINNCLTHSGESIRIGITGIPGVGKSTFIDVFGNLLTKKGHKVAVLAIDPTSKKTQGSILGDKTRMSKLSNNENAFVRPSPNKNTLGGIAAKTRESIILCEAAGFDIILIETVGVGQSETKVESIVDFFLLLMLAGAGDELQGIKRGIMELADALIITKSDGKNLQDAKNAALRYKNAIHLFPITENGWIPQVKICSALENNGIDQIYNLIIDFDTQMKNNGWKKENRYNQQKLWLHQIIKEELGNQKYEKLLNENVIEKFEITLSESKSVYHIFDRLK